jgi:hypothetical protein
MPEILFERLAGRLRVEKDVESCWGEEAARATLQAMKIRMARKKESEARQLYVQEQKVAGYPGHKFDDTALEHCSNSF